MPSFATLWRETLLPLFKDSAASCPFESCLRLSECASRLPASAGAVRLPLSLLGLVLLAGASGAAVAARPLWGDANTPADGGFAIENYRAPSSIHRIAPVNPELGAPGGRLSSSGGAANGNYSVSLPLIAVPGRGVSLNLAATFNAQVWSERALSSTSTLPPVFFDADGDWPAPGWTIGFGKLLREAMMFIGPDGSRVPLKRITGGGWKARFADGSGRSVDCVGTPSSCAQGYDHLLRVNLENGAWMEMQPARDGVLPARDYYPVRLGDVHGNFILIEYRVDTNGNPEFPAIEKITDTVGRVFQFHYDSNGRPIALTGPDLQSGTRVYARFYYKPVDVNVQIPARRGSLANPERARSPTFYANNARWRFDALQAVYFPGNRSAVSLDGFTKFGMPTTVDWRRDMTPTSNSLTTEGNLQGGTSTRRSTFSLPDSVGYFMQYKKVPRYSTRTDSWIDPIDGHDRSATTSFSVDQQRVHTTILPDGMKFQQRSVTDRTRFDYGLADWSRWVDKDGKALTTTTYVWEQGLDGLPRQNAVRVENHEIAAHQVTTFAYGATNREIVDRIVYDYLPNRTPPPPVTPTKILSRTLTKYVQTPSYRDKNFTLPEEVTVLDAGGSMTPLERTTFVYDEFALQTVSPQPANYAQQTLPAASGGTRGNVTTVYRWLGPDSGPPSSGGAGVRGIATSFRYDETGNQRKVINPGAASDLDISYDSATQFSLPTSVSFGGTTAAAGGRVTTTTSYFVNAGLPFRVADADQKVVEFGYEPAGAGWRSNRQVTTTGVTTRYLYDDRSLSVVSRVADAEGRTYTQTALFDGRGLIRRVQTARSNGSFDSVERDYDNIGRVTKVGLPSRSDRNAAPLSTTYGYDAAGRLNRISGPGSMGATRFVFNGTRTDGSSALGQTVLTTGRLGEQSWSLSDALGRTRISMLPDPTSGRLDRPGISTISLSYDGAGRLRKVTDGPLEQRFVYDSLGRRTALAVPERDAMLDIRGDYQSAGGLYTDVYSYDDNSRLVSQTDARGVKTIFDYGTDPLGRLQSISYDLTRLGDTQAQVQPTPTTSFTYEQSGNLLRLKSATTAGVVTKEYLYDNFKRLKGTKETHASAASAPIQIAFDADSVGRVEQVRLPARFGSTATSGLLHAVEYRYSADGELDQVLLNGTALASNVKFGPLGLEHLDLTGIGPTLRESYEPDGATGQTRSFRLADVASGQTLFELSNVLDAPSAAPAERTTGQIFGQSGELRGSRWRNGDFTYDARGRLQSIRRGVTQQNYSYDNQDNRLTVTATSTVPSLPWVQIIPDGESTPVTVASNRVQAVRGVTLEYDRAGNLLTNPRPDGTTHRYFYDAAGRLVTVREVGTNRLVEQYQYGADRRRIAVSQDGSKWTYSLWLGSKELAQYEEESSGSFVARDMSIFMGSRLLAEVRRNAAGGNLPDTVTLSHPDHRGGVLATTWANGTYNLRRQSTLPFGTDTTPASEVDGERRFTTYRRSPSTGLDYAVNRFYDSKLGRFTQPDPAMQGRNLYAYADNDPINHIDPVGLRAILFPTACRERATKEPHQPGKHETVVVGHRICYQIVWVPDDPPAPPGAPNAGGRGGGGRPGGEGGDTPMKCAAVPTDSTAGAVADALERASSNFPLGVVPNVATVGGSALTAATVAKRVMDARSVLVLAETGATAVETGATVGSVVDAAVIVGVEAQTFSASVAAAGGALPAAGAVLAAGVAGVGVGILIDKYLLTDSRGRPLGVWLYDAIYDDDASPCK